MTHPHRPPTPEEEQGMSEEEISVLRHRYPTTTKIAKLPASTLPIPNDETRYWDEEEEGE